MREGRHLEGIVKRDQYGRFVDSLSEAHRVLPWEEYLHPSDHFGIFFELKL